MSPPLSSLLAAAAVLVAVAAPGASAVYLGNTNCRQGTDVIVHLFEWKWTDVATECVQFLGPNDFCGVQVSPAHEHRVFPDAPRPYPWWQRYQPVSYILDSRGGTPAQFTDMVRRCNDAGVRIYADTIINHMTYEGVGVGSGGSDFDADSESYPAVPWVPENFHGADVCGTADLKIADYQNASEVRYCRLNGLRDLRHAQEAVRARLAEYLNGLIDLGVAGFRVDAAKHMLPGDLEDIYGRLRDLNTDWFPEGTRPYAFQEVIDMGGEPISSSEYTYMARVTEFRYGKMLGDVVRKNDGQQLASLVDFGEAWGFLPSDGALTFLDNHDNQRGHGAGGFNSVLTFFEGDMYRMAAAFMLAWDYGHLKLMSSYDWPRDVQDGVDLNDWMGPPSDSEGVTDDVTCDDGWICEHRWAAIAAMVKFHNAALGKPVDHWWDNGKDAIAFARGDAAFIAINNEDGDLSERLQTGLLSGQYCDVITCDNNRPPCGNSRGACREEVTVGEDGIADIRVPAGQDPIVALYR